MAIKLLIGGSPCTHWSIAQKNNRETEPEGLGWELFKNYLIAKEKFKPDYFLYENNKSAAQPIKDQISRELGVDLMYINSALVSAQNRQRFYAFNWEVEQPEDRGILLKDVLETGDAWREKAYCLDANYYKATSGTKPFGRSQSSQRMCVAEPIFIGEVPEHKGTYRNGKQASQQYRVYDTDAKSVAVTTCAITNVAEPVRVPEYGVEDKARPITASYAHKGSGEGSLASEAFPDNPNKQVRDYVAEAVGIGYRGRMEDGKWVKRYESNGEPKANALTTAQTDSMVAEPIRVGDLPNGKGEISGSQATRIYSTDGKSVNLVANGGGQGAKTGLYAVPVNHNGYATPCEWDGDGRPTKAVSCADGKTYTVYKVEDGKITIKGKQYPIKLVDGYYIIRKLTVTECCRLQTMPDDYCKAVSNTQAYKGLGNGWTAEVIIHILNGVLKDVPRDEEIVVLSMYDGIGTGRYCLEKMGFTNVKYYAYEIDPHPIKIAMDNYPDIIQSGDAFAVRENDWKPPKFAQKSGIRQ